MDPNVKYLLSLRSIRDRAKIVGQIAEAGKLAHFDVHEDKLDDVVDLVVSVIKRDYGPDKYHTIPPHGRWQHFEVGGIPRIANLLDQWKKEEGGCDDVEVARRLIDLFFVSVLLDAGAGDHWRYVEPATGNTYERSEGIAVASLDMFNKGAFVAASSEGGQSAPIVNGKGLAQLETRALAEGFQVTEENPMLGVDSRAGLLRSLGESLLAHPEVFGAEGRPGKLVDYLLAKRADESSPLDILILWDVLQTLLIPAWPKNRTIVAGTPIGDAWPLSILQQQQQAKADTPEAAVAGGIQPFHKLTQWLTYSLMVPFQRVLNLQWTNADSLTALPEYRNGGLFVDLGVLTLKEDTLKRGLQAASGGGGDLPLFDAGDDTIVEWRAMTLVLIDKLYTKIESKFGDGVELSMAQLLEAGTWKSGREVAAQRRPKTKSSPILINSDGTVF